MKRPRVKRSNRPPSQAVVDHRMREIWIQGLVYLPHDITEAEIGTIRIALRKLSDDQKYWDGLAQLRDKKIEVSKLADKLRGLKG